MYIQFFKKIQKIFRKLKTTEKGHHFLPHFLSALQYYRLHFPDKISCNRHKNNLTKILYQILAHWIVSLQFMYHIKRMNRNSLTNIPLFGQFVNDMTKRLISPRIWTALQTWRYPPIYRPCWLLRVIGRFAFRQKEMAVLINQNRRRSHLCKKRTKSSACQRFFLFCHWADFFFHFYN